MIMKEPAVYIVANKRNGTLYIGVTSDLIKRIRQHKSSVHRGFAQKYKISRLVYFEFHENMMLAIKREKQLKNWKRAWKIELIEEKNPTWVDLYHSLLG